MSDIESIWKFKSTTNKLLIHLFLLDFPPKIYPQKFKTTAIAGESIRRTESISSLVSFNKLLPRGTEAFWWSLLLPLSLRFGVVGTGRVEIQFSLSAMKY